MMLVAAGFKKLCVALPWTAPVLVPSIAFAVLAVACAPPSADERGSASAPIPPGAEVRLKPDTTTEAPPSQATSTTDRPRIVILGDSLTAGLGLENVADSFPGQIQKRLDAAGLRYEVVNMGVSGDTSAGGLRRFDWAVEGDVKVLVVALGGNDGLRGLPPEELERNLTAIVERGQARGMRVLLCGMEAPPNFGQSYTRAFHDVYPRVAEKTGAVLLPFLLEGVAGVPSLNQGDGIHPSREGALRVADLVWTRLEPMLRDPAPR
jgi:acyl-CoA thioesterase-1